MQLYSIIVTLHILTATGMFMAWAAEWAVGSIGGRIARIGMLAMVLTILSGIFLMVKTWGPQPWITAAIINLVGIITVGLTVGKRNPKVAMVFKLVLGLVILLLMSLKAGVALTSVLTITGWVLAFLLWRLRIRRQSCIPLETNN